VLVAYRLLSPGSEWRLHRHWFEQSAVADLLGGDAGLAESHKLYACHDKLLAHKTALFDHLVARWRDLFNVEFDVLLYDLTSTYFEANPPFGDEDKRRFGYSRDKRPDCVQVVSPWWSPPRVCRWPTRCCPAIPRIRPRCAIFSIVSSTSTARPAESGSWTAASPPRKRSDKCASLTHR
jgi:hypothetical protein